MISPNFSLRRRASWSTACATALVAASLAVGASAFGQSYSTTFNEGTGTYPQPQGSLSGQGGWDTNDAAKNGYVGQSDYVGQVSGYTGSSASNLQGALGGLFHGTGANQDLPGASIVYLYHAFNPGGSSSYTFNTDLDISFPASGTTTGTPNTTRDSFGFNFQTSGLANLFSVNFTPDLSGAGNSANQMIVGYTVNGVQTIPTAPGANSILYNGIYHLRITVTATSMSINVTGTNGFNIANIPLTGVTTSSLQQVAATWTLKTTTAGTIDSNGGYTQAGSNALVFDNFSIAVPEPSTWAMLGAGVVCLAVYVRRRVRA